MKQITVIKRHLAVGMLIAALILHAGINKQVMANTGFKAGGHNIVGDNIVPVGDEEHSSIFYITFFGRI
ncbi:MAG: hypothetical protein ABI707_08020 [Ferruginibacter sp.]